MKKIGIDFSPAEISPAGIGQYTINFVRTLFKIDSKNKYFLYSTQPVTLIDIPANVTSRVIPFPKRFRARGVRWMLQVTNDIKKEKLDLFLSFSNHFFSLSFPKTVQFVHDLAPIKFPQYFPHKARFFYPFTTRLALSKAKMIATISEQVKQELIDYGRVKPEKIIVLYPSLNESLFSHTGGAKRELPKNYLMTVSTLEPRKNLIAGIRAFAKLLEEKALPADYQYLIVGKLGWYYLDILKQVKTLGLETQVKFLGYVPDNELEEIFINAKAFIYLSNYEGFGMPPLEGLYYNLPTVLSDLPVFRECFQGLTKLVPPDDIPAIAAAIKASVELKHRPDTRAAVMKKFTWENTARKFLAFAADLS
jgi:glycosyltransferase involved in cell wall biosynthesis